MQRASTMAILKDYPFLSPEEFAEACHHLDSRYCRATLGPLRRRWKLRVRTALDTSFSVDGGYSTYVQIIRTPLETRDDLDLDLTKFSISGPQVEDSVPPEDGEMVDAEESDKAAIVTISSHDTAFVAYEIHLHPTYRVPCLWFSIHGLPKDEPALHIDTAFRRLVPDEYKEGLRGMGGIGGISADHHPLTGLPSFFVHPCLLGDAMSNFSCNSKNYLMVWLGLVGGCVGLWVPKEMAIQ
ncbi:E2-like conjugating enzyme atg10 [Claviceps citrina]|nr:E2-like conjugating enzyme atg10 [Claviceps citrina]